MKIGMAQRVSVLLAAVIAIGASYLQAAGLLGLTPDEFADSGASTLRAASWAFSIWGIIYAGLVVYAVYQLVPGWAPAHLLRRFGWPSALSMLAIGAWLVAAGANWRWATVGLIALATVVLIVPLTSRPGHAEGPPAQGRDTLLIVTPLALLAGWLTIATALNMVTVLTAEGFISAEAATPWALGALTATLVVTVLVFRRSGVLAYPVPVVWGLVAVFVAQRPARPDVAWFALAAAVALTGVVAWSASPRHAPREVLS